MPFTHPRMAFVSLLPHYLRTYMAMTDIRFCAKATYARSIRHEYSDVMEHCCLDDKLAVNVQFGMCITNTHSTLHYERAVRDEDVTQLGVVIRIVSVDYFLVIQNSNYFNVYVYYSASLRWMYAITSPLRTFAPCLALISTSCPPRAAGIVSNSPHGVRI